MRIDDEMRRMSGRGLRSAGLPGRLAAVLLGALLLLAGLFFSLLVFAGALCVGLLFGALRWWQLRGLRRTQRVRAAAGGFSGRAPGGGRVIEGEVVRDEAPAGRIGQG